MKRVIWPVVVVLGLGGAYIGTAHFSGGSFSTLGLPLGGDAGELRRTAMAFWEDIQFKDFQAAAEYHAPDLQDSVDIPFLIQRIFLLKPELLDIMEYEIVMVDIDKSGNRARIRSRVKVKELARGKIQEKQIMLYFARDDASSPWYMRLEDSLRPDKADEGKKH